MSTHPFIKYGVAVVLRENNLSKVEDITRQHLIKEIENSINHFRVKPEGVINDQKFVKFTYSNDPKPQADKGIYLSPSILHIDKTSQKNMYPALLKMLEVLNDDKVNKVTITNTIAPVSAEYCSFGAVVGRGKPSLPISDAANCIITTTTNKKPCISYKTYIKEKGKIKPQWENIAIIPDLEIVELVDFINLFEKMREQSTEGLMFGFVSEKDKKPQRPRLFDGNFPNAPRSSSLGVIGLLGAIGAWAKDAAMIGWTTKVLDSLKGKPIYLIGTKRFETYKYNHFIIELAKENKLSSIIDSIYYTTLYNQKPRNNGGDRLEYQKFDIFVARFLQLFNIPAFKDFLSFRAEYPNQLEILFKTYFVNMEKITTEIVQSARELGKWLNYAAYKVANNNIEKNAQDRPSKVREQKAKSLIEIESSVFSARSGDALIFQAITRAGRASGLDAPAEAELFMEKVSTGEVSLDSAKHLLIAFSRVRNKYEPKSTSNDEGVTSNEDPEEDFSDGQE